MGFIYLLLSGVFVAFVEAQFEANETNDIVCRVGSGERFAYNVTVSDGDTVDILGAISCAPGYLPDPPYCEGWKKACPCVVNVCQTWGGTCTSEGECLWQRQSITPAPFATCGGANVDFIFSGCGCPSGHYLNLSYEPIFATDSISPTKCQSCTLGTYSPIGSTAATECDVCAAGQYDGDADPGTPCVDCAAGRFSTVMGSTSCGGGGDCGAGTHAPAGSAACSGCDAGKFDDDSNSTTPCIVCVAGNFTSDPLHCDGSCPTGTYSPPGSKTSADCEPCSLGDVDDDNNAATACVPCSAGNFSIGPFHCVGCEVDTYALKSSSECVVCPAGRLAPAQSKSVHYCDCPAGSFPVNEVTAEATYGCVPCDGGTMHYDASNEFGEPAEFFFGTQLPPSAGPDAILDDGTGFNTDRENGYGYG